jgi:PTS system galactitol-specific IIB component
MPTKKVLVICGTGVATSTVVASSIREHCTAAGIDVVVTQGKVMDLLGGNPDVDLVVSTTEVPSSTSVPVVAGLPFLTGVGKDAVLEEIVRILKS